MLFASTSVNITHSVHKYEVLWQFSKSLKVNQHTDIIVLVESINTISMKIFAILKFSLKVV